MKAEDLEFDASDYIRFTICAIIFTIIVGAYLISWWFDRRKRLQTAKVKLESPWEFGPDRSEDDEIW